MSGYTLKTQYFDGSVAHFWPADQAQIYRTLQKLERDGEATSAEVAGDSRPAQRVYTISATGLTALKDWLSVQHSPSAQRSTFLVQIYFSRLNSRENVAALLNAERLRQEAMLHMTESIDLDPKQAGTEQLREQYEFGNFLASGRKVPRTGGIILSKVENKSELEKIIEKDPFKINNLADYKLTEFIPSKTCDELNFLME